MTLEKLYCRAAGQTNRRIGNRHQQQTAHRGTARRRLRRDRLRQEPPRPAGRNRRLSGEPGRQAEAGTGLSGGSRFRCSVPDAGPASIHPGTLGREGARLYSDLRNGGFPLRSVPAARSPSRAPTARPPRRPSSRNSSRRRDIRCTWGAT